MQKVLAARMQIKIMRHLWIQLVIFSLYFH